MRFRIVSVACVVTLLSMAAIANSSLKQGGKSGGLEAASLLKAARNAMGGEARLAAVKSLILKGEDRGRNEWFGQGPGAIQEWFVRSLEMQVLFPDHFVKIGGPISGLGTTGYRNGFSGTDPVPAPGPGKAPIPTWPEFLKSDREAFGRLMLVLLLRTDTAAPALLRAGAESASTVAFNGLGTYPVFLDLDRTTLLPVRIRYQLAMRTAGGPTGEISQQSMSVDDWRDVQGLKLPYHLTLTVNDKVSQDTRFKSIEINPPLTAADFK